MEIGLQAQLSSCDQQVQLLISKHHWSNFFSLHNTPINGEQQFNGSQSPLLNLFNQLLGISKKEHKLGFWIQMGRGLCFNNDFQCNCCIIIIMILKDRYQILKGYANNHVTIGFGSYGQVKLARDLQTTQIVAVKINKIAKNQVMMHYGLAHPKIIKLLDVHIDTEREITYMMLEYAEGGTLFDKIKMETIPKSQVKKYFRDICEGVAYLHSQNIMHRDIKPQNVLLTKNNEAKLCDFGFAAILGERKTLCGTYEYMSPEMIQNRPYDYKIDIWALGILMFELMSGHAPFRGQKPEDVLEQMKTKIYFCERFQPEDINLIKTILRVTPQKRPTIQEILDQPFFKLDQKNQKSQQLTARSTTNTQDLKQNSPSFQYLNESCNPKKMAELQKLLEKEQPKQTQKQTYPPFYVPKTTQKFGIGVPVVNNQQRQLKSYSPLHGNRPIAPNTLPVNNGYYRPMTQMNPPNSVNKSFNNPPFKGGNQPQSQSQMPPTNPPTNYVNPNKTNVGFGRFS